MGEPTCTIWNIGARQQGHWMPPAPEEILRAISRTKIDTRTPWF
jgi:hypothetical protein